MEIKEILEKLKQDEISIEDAEKEIKNNSYEDLGYAKIDHNRKERQGTSEVVFCQGKPNEFLSKIYKTIYKENGEVLGTRATKEQYELVKKGIPNVAYDSISKILKIEKEKQKIGNIVVCTGGTADIPVAEETANRLKQIADNSNYDFYICQTNGTNDAVFSQPDNQMKAMFKLTDTFNSSNLIYLMREDGYHDMDSVVECTYNGLQRVF